jgi:hypothetical protein
VLGLAATLVITVGGIVTWRYSMAEATALVADDARDGRAASQREDRPALWRPWTATRAAALVVVVALGCFVHFFRLGTSSWNFDEYFYALVGRNFLDGDFSVPPGPHPYIGTYLVGLVPSITGSVSTTAARVMPAVAGVATGFMLLVFARRVRGVRAGMIALALWLLLPHATAMGGEPFTAIRVERFALLEPFGSLFVAAALYGGWRWTESRSWPWAAATGVCAGLAVACKFVESFAIIPVAALAFIAPGRGRTRAAQAALALALCATAVWLSFAPVLTEAPERVRAMLDLASANEAAGHPTIIAGDVYARAPRWANPWFMGAGMGLWVSIALTAAAVAGAALIERRLAIYLATAVVVPAVALAGFYAIALPHYYVVWLPPLTLLAALGFDALLGRRGWRRAAAAILAIPLAIGVVKTVDDVSSLRAGDYRAAAAILRRADVARGRVAVVGYAAVLCAYLPLADVTFAADDETDAIIIDPVQERRGDAFKVGGFLRAHRKEFVGARADRLRVFIRSGRAPATVVAPSTRSAFRCYSG